MSKLKIRVYQPCKKQIVFETIYIDPSIIRGVKTGANNGRVFPVYGKMVVISFGYDTNIRVNKETNSINITLNNYNRERGRNVTKHIHNLYENKDDVKYVPIILEAFNQFAKTGYFQAKEETVTIDEHTYSF